MAFVMSYLETRRTQFEFTDEVIKEMYLKATKDACDILKNPNHGFFISIYHFDEDGKLKIEAYNELLDEWVHEDMCHELDSKGSVVWFGGESWETWDRKSLKPMSLSEYLEKRSE